MWCGQGKTGIGHRHREKEDEEGGRLCRKN